MNILKKLAGYLIVLGLFGALVATSPAQNLAPGTRTTTVLNGLLTTDGTNVTLASEQFLFPDGTEALPSLSFTTDPDSGIYSAGADTIGFSVGASDVFSITTAQIDLLAAFNTIQYPQDADLYIAEATDADAYIYLEGDPGLITLYSDGLGVWQAGQATNTSPAIDLVVLGVGATGLSRGLVRIEADSIPSMDGDDQQSALFINITNTAGHTGANNFLYGLDIDDIVEDVDVTEAAINIQAGWDAAIAIADGSVTDDAICLGAGGCAADAAIYFDGAGLEFDVDSTSNDITFFIQAVSTSYWLIDSSGGTGEIRFIPANAVNAGVNIFEIEQTAVNATDGTGDIINVFTIDFNDTDWAAAGTDELRGLYIDAITADADATNTAINIGAGWDYGLSILADGSATDDNITLGASQTADAQIYFDGNALTFDVDATTTNDIFMFLGASSGATWKVEATAAGNSLLYIPINAANAGFNHFEFDVSALNALNGSDTVNLVIIDLDDTEFATGASNVLNALYIDAITADADATNTAINIGAGWDYGLSILADGSATDDNITLGASQTADAQIYFDGAALTFDVDGTATNDVLFEMGVGDTTTFTVQDGGVANMFQFIPQNTANSGLNLFEIEVAAVAATDGSDIINMLLLDWNETDWATSTETLNGLNIDGITQDAQGTYNAINIGAGWGVGVRLDDGSATDDNITFGVGGDLVLWSDGDSGHISSPNDTLFLSGPTSTGQIWFRTGTDVLYRINGGNAARHTFDDESGIPVGEELIEALGTFSAQNGDDTTMGLSMNMTNADHTGTGNLVYGIGISGITADADATESAINIGAGWDIGLWLQDGSATDDNITLGASATADAQIYFDGSALTFDVDGTATNDVLFEMGVGDSTTFTVQDGGVANLFRFIPQNTANSGLNLFEIEVAAVAATDGSDIITMLELDWNETDWATATEVLNGIHIDTITQDAQGTYNAIQIASGWDISIQVANRRVDDAEAIECTDNAGGGNQAITLTPTGSYVEITQSDAQGCDVTMGEAAGTVYEGQLVDIAIVSVTAGAVNFADTGGLSELAGAFAADINDTLRLRYTGTTWVEVSRSAN